ncbi:MAG: asparagine--tRNA ligase [Calditrichia bacterium]
MAYSKIKEIWRKPEDFIGKSVKIAGWVRTLRASKNFGFIEVNDGSFFKNLQVVFDEKLDNFEAISKFTIASSIEVDGTIVESAGAKQPFELHAERISLIGHSENDYPLQKKRHSFEYLRTIAHLRPRTNTFLSVFRVRSLLAHAIHTFFQDRNFVYVHTPIITASDAEGAGQMFRVSTLDAANPPRKPDGSVDFEEDFFSRQAHLTVSGQLNVETYCMAFRDVYTFGPTFRAENSNTARHASEFWMIEPEIAFADINDNMDLAEQMIKFIFNYVIEKAPEEMEFFNQWIDKGLLARLDNVINSEFKRITYTEAVEQLQKSGQKFEFPVEWGKDLQSEHERYLTEQVYKKPVFVVNYPKGIKAFYMRQNDDGKTVAAMDLLVPGVGEIIGGSQREERYDKLVARIDELGLEKDDYWWYLDLRKYGTAPHAGYGLGFARAIMYATGMENIRDVVPFPRTPRNADF